MGWNDLAPNQMVSFIDIQGSNFTLKEGKSPIDTNQCITRDEVLDMYNINPVSVAIYSGNQLIPKSSLTGSGQSIVLCYDQNNFITACDYCINPPPPPPTGPFDFKTGFNGFISTIQVQTNGNLIVGGRYTTYRNISTQPLVRLLMNGDVDPTFTVPTIQNGGQQPSIQSAIILGDGRIIVAGSFRIYGSTNAPGLMILNSNGTLNATTNVTDGICTDLKLDQSGNILVRGNSVNNVYGQIIKLNPNLTFNTSYLNSSSTSELSTCYELVEGTTNKLYIGITYGTIVTSIEHRIERHNYLTGAYEAQSPLFNRPIRDIKALPDGRLIVVGEFTQYNGQSTRQIVVLNPNFTVNTLFPNGFSSISPNVDGVAGKILLQSDGKILIGGIPSRFRTFTPSQLDFMPPFQFFNGVSSNSIVRLNADFTRDSSFVMGTGFEFTGSTTPALGGYPSVFAMATQSIGGSESLVFGGVAQKYNNSIIYNIVSTTTSGTKNSL